MQFLIEIVEAILEFFSGGRTDDRRRLESAETSSSSGGEDRGGRASGGRGPGESPPNEEPGDQGSPQRPLERLAAEHDWEYLDSSESPPEAGPEIRGSIEDRAMRVFRDADGGALTVQMPVREFQGAIVYMRDPDQSSTPDSGAAAPDWAQDGAGGEMVEPDIEAPSQQSRTLYQNLPDELRDQFTRLMRENGVTSFVINSDRTEMLALEVPGMYDGAQPVQVADEMVDVAHQMTSMAEAGRAGDLGPGEQYVGEGMTEGTVFEKVTCEYCQTEFQAINRHKCPNCGAPVRGD